MISTHHNITKIRKIALPVVDGLLVDVEVDVVIVVVIVAEIMIKIFHMNRTLRCIK